MRIQTIFCLLLAALCAGSTRAQSWFTTGQAADLMLSGVDFNRTGGPLTFNHPNGVATDGTHFLLCDRFNNRILVWNSLPASWDDAPDFVLGQPDFNANNPGTGKHQLNWVGNVSVGANGKVAVADTENDRILLWNAFPTANGQPASVSIYLPALTPAGSVIQYGWPWGVWTDGTRLAAVATSGGALLFWNNFPAVDNTPPDYTLKRPEFGTPRNISTDGSTYFFVGDHNARVTGQPGTFFWNSYPAVADQPYDFYRDEWIKGEKLPDGRLVAGGLSSFYIWNKMPTQASHTPDLKITPSYYKNGDGVDVTAAGGRLFVNNYNGNDVLVYNTIPTQTSQAPDFALGAPAPTAQTLDSIYYVQNPILATDGTRLIVSSDFDRALYVWDQWPTHSGQAYDHRITPSPGTQIWANALYNNRFVLAARNSISIWDDAGKLQSPPSRQFLNSIGTAALNDITGVALDGSFFYVGLRNGTIYVWEGIPANGSVNPVLTLSVGSSGGHLSSDGEYFCAVRPEPPTAVLIYKISELAAGLSTPFRTINNSPQASLNQCAHAITFNGALAIANRANHNVLLWKTPADWGNPSKMVVLGQPNAAGREAAIGASGLFMPNYLLYHGDQLWVGEFKFSSRILRYSSGLSALGGSSLIETAPQLFPNPGNGAFTLAFEAPRSDQYTIDLADVHGRLLHRIFEGQLTEKEYFTRAFEVQAPAGIYFINIRSAESRGTARLVIR